MENYPENQKHPADENLNPPVGESAVRDDHPAPETEEAQAHTQYWQAPGYYGQEPVAPPQEENAPPAQPVGQQASAQGSPYMGADQVYPPYSVYQQPQGNYQQPAQQAPYTAPQGTYQQPAQQAPYTAPQGAYQQPQTEYSAPQQPYQGEYIPPQPPRKAPRSRRIWPAVVITAVACLLVGALVTVAVLPLFGVNLDAKVEVTDTDPGAVSDPVGNVVERPGMNPDFTFDSGDGDLSYVTSGGLADMAEAVTPSIVGVLNLTYQKQNNYYGYGFGAPSQGGDTEPYLQETGSGSGVIITADGYIVTNAHVVDGADALQILMNDGEKVDAVLVGTDEVTDLAVVKVEKNNLPAAHLGDSEHVRVGELAVAIGNPLGSELAGTVTMGIISAVERTIQVENQYIDVLQTDAAINPGNSGGALVNQAGQVIGITSAKTVVAGYDSYGNAISAEGIGYAIPINDAKPIVEQLIRTGSVPRPALGVTVTLVTNSIETDQHGLLVSEVTPGGSADKAGIRVNDVITHLNGKSFDSLSDFKQELMKYSVGDTITLKVSRNEENIEVSVTLMDAKAISGEKEEESEPDSQWVIPGYGFNPFG